MILADTSVWIDHFRASDPELAAQLGIGQIVVHPFIIAELALGSLPQRAKILGALDLLPSVRVARLDEVRQMIESRRLFSLGIGLTDAHLIAAVLITPSTLLWTRDKRLRSVAESLDVHVNLP
jgi:predicted nucleic acid-binding protein